MKRVRFKIFLIDTAFNTAMFTSIALIAFLNQKYFETLFFLISFFALRPMFPTTYHCKKLKSCAYVTVAVFALSIPITLPITISLFSSVLVGVLVTYSAYRVQLCVNDKVELSKLKTKTIWDLSESELREYLRSRGIINERQEFVCLKLSGWSYGQIAKKLGYSEPTMWDWSEICRKKLGIKSWKRDKN